MRKIIILIPVISLFLFSCGNTSNEKSKEQTETIAHEEHQHNDENETIELNNGAKWKVDPNMITHIRNMESDVISFAKVDQKDYKSLSEKLQSNIDSLTSNCTMKGKAHDELHKWLVPFIELSEQFDATQDLTEQEKIYHDFKKAFVEFNIYFE